MTKVEFASKTPHPDFPAVENVHPEEVLKLKESLRLIDVRRPDEFEGELGHIPGAELMVLDTLPSRLSELPKDQTVVFICRSGGRSGQATAFAKDHGFQEVYNMAGGMLLWNQLGLEVEGRSE